MGSVYAPKVWKCLPTYDDFGKESYEKYLFKLIVEMSKEDELSENEAKVLSSLKGLRKVNEIATKDEIRSLILDCSALLYKE